MKKILIFALAIIGLSFIIGIFSYNFLPGRIASHWSSVGEANGYMSKFWGLFLMPIISIVLFILFLLIPLIDPLKKNIEGFRAHYDSFIFATIIFMFYIYILTLVWNFGYKFNMTYALVPALGILFYYLGSILDKLKRNWFIGIRTPWTLCSDNVWRKTHHLGSILFKISGIIAIIGILFLDYVIYFLLGPLIISVTIMFIYSYFVWKEEERTCSLIKKDDNKVHSKTSSKKK